MPPDISPNQTEFAVNIFGRHYLPSSINVPIGATVTWTNLDTEVHNVTSGNIIGSDIKLFASGTLDPNASFSYTFNQSGIFYYYRESFSADEIPPEIAAYGGLYPGMMGRVIVGEPEIQEVAMEITDVALWIVEHDE
jgi:hypothetical protein